MNTTDIVCVSCNIPFPVFVREGRELPERYICPCCYPDWWYALNLAQPWFWTQVAQFVALAKFAPTPD